MIKIVSPWNDIAEHSHLYKSVQSDRNARHTRARAAERRRWAAGVEKVATQNPYRAPESKVAIDSELSAERLGCLVAGQKTISIAILLYSLGAIVFFSINRRVGFPVLLLAYMTGLAGFIKAIKGAELKAYSKLLYGISMLIPILNILVLAHLDELVIRELKVAGYKIGTFGVKGRHST